MREFFSRFELQKLDKLAPFVFFILLVWLCWRLANLFWWVISPPQTPVIQSVTLGSQQPVMPNIVRFSLFEEQGQNPQAQSQSNLAMKLEGVLLANPSYLSSAVIRIDNHADRYRVGEQIAESNYTLAEVYWDRAIVKTTSGQTQELKFGEESSTASLSSASLAEGADNQDNNAVAPLQNSNQQAISGAIEQIQQDREQYLNRMGVSAGEGGFEISERTPPALRARLGLKAGDKIVSVNGQAITAGTNEAQLLEQIRKTGQAKIEIQRGDQTMTIQQNF